MTSESSFEKKETYFLVNNLFPNLNRRDEPDWLFDWFEMAGKFGKLLNTFAFFSTFS